MQPIVTNMATLAAVFLYYFWRAHSEAQQRRRRLLCQRVAYLLWSVAGQIRDSDSGLSPTCRR